MGVTMYTRTGRTVDGVGCGDYWDLMQQLKTGEAWPSWGQLQRATQYLRDAGETHKLDRMVDTLANSYIYVSWMGIGYINTRRKPIIVYDVYDPATDEGHVEEAKNSHNQILELIRQ